MAEPTNPNHETVREREVIVTDGGHRSGLGSTLVAIIGILVVLLVGYFAIQAIGGSGDGGGIPDSVDVNINDSTGGGGS